MVNETSSFWFLSLCNSDISLYLTIRCIVKEIVIIRSNDMKLDDTTVTRQSIKPSNPITKRATNPLDARGMATHLAFLNIAPRVMMNIIKTPKAKYRRSLFIKLIMSEAIMAVPPK